MVDDLRALLVNANIPGPYVLVAHSGAGFNARLYAHQYPHDVVGMVLVDSAHPDQYTRLLAFLPPESPLESGAVKKLRQDWGDIDQRDMPESWDFNTSAAQVRATSSLGDLPLVVLTQDVYDLEPRLSEWKILYGADFPPELAESLDQEWLQMQKELAALSTNSTHIIATGSGHMIPLQRPDAVIDAISHVIDAVQNK
jgi:pimeloyl-ACP methyl ester carboxylesterase